MVEDLSVRTGALAAMLLKPRISSAAELVDALILRNCAEFTLLMEDDASSMKQQEV